jgi:hypothetical protein
MGGCESLACSWLVETVAAAAAELETTGEAPLK